MSRYRFSTFSNVRIFQCQDTPSSRYILSRYPAVQIPDLYDIPLSRYPTVQMPHCQYTLLSVYRSDHKPTVEIPHFYTSHCEDIPDDTVHATLSRYPTFKVLSRKDKSTPPATVNTRVCFGCLSSMERSLMDRSGMIWDRVYMYLCLAPLALRSALIRKVEH